MMSAIHCRVAKARTNRQGRQVSPGPRSRRHLFRLSSWLLAAAAVLSGHQAHAQVLIVDGPPPVVIDDETVNATEVRVGDLLPDSFLTIQNAGVLNNSGIGYIGFDADAVGTATVTGTGSQWTNSSELHVGSSGAGTLTIDNGGRVANTIGSIGTNAGSSGTVAVSGTGSLWTNTSVLRVGVSGDGTLNIAGGGRVTSPSGQIGGLAGSTGTASVTDAGSQWTTGSLAVGVAGNGTLGVENGGRVQSTGGNIGIIVGSVGAATVTGTGSQWNLSQPLTVGSNGTGTLNVLNGGVVTSALGTIGNTPSGTGTATVAGTGSQWTGSAQLRVGLSGNGTLNVESGGLVSSNLGYIGANAGSNGTATITGTGSQWNSGTELNVGFSGNGTLNITGGGMVTSSLGVIATNSGSVGTVNVAGGEWTNRTGTGELFVGLSGTGTLKISSGGKVSNDFGSIGVNSGSTGTVSVTSGEWSSGSLLVGDSGTGTLTIGPGGKVHSDSSHIALRLGSTGTANVTGGEWTTNNSVIVGDNGTGTLRIEAGGRVASSVAVIGLAPGSSGTAIVTGSGSHWTNSGDLRVGGVGNGTLRIENGGALSSNNGLIGAGAFGELGTATVTGSGSQWTMTGNLAVGQSAPGVLTIEDGGRVTNRLGGISRLATATVTGVGSQWINSAELRVDGTLGITNSGFVSSSSGVIGVGPWAAGVTVTNGGHWATGVSGVIVGSNAFSGTTGTATLTIETGGRVTGGFSVIGYTPESIGTVTVTTGGEWMSALTVGLAGTATLDIESGGEVLNLQNTAYIARGTGSVGTATVAGAGSRWTEISHLYIGGNEDGAGGLGTLNIANGGFVSVGGTTRIWETGTLNLSGGELRTGSLLVSPGGTFNQTGGVLTIVNGVFDNSGGTTTLGPDAVLQLQGGATATHQNLIVDPGAQISIGSGGGLTVTQTLTNEGLIQIATGGLLAAISTDNTGTIQNHGTLLGDVFVHSGGVMTGTGIFDGVVTIGDGGVFSPGGSPGQVGFMAASVWEAGGAYAWEINALADFGGSEGNDPGWDYWHTGDLTIAGPYTIAITSLTSGNESGLLAGWDPLQDYQWRIASANNAAFLSLDLLSVSWANFLNSLAGGSFWLSAGDGGYDLYLNFRTADAEPIPEPSSIALLGLGILGLIGNQLRRRRASTVAGRVPLRQSA